jgi:hypothetical protein
MRARNPAVVKNAYTDDSIWRNRDTFLTGHDEIVAFLTKKWEKEIGYRLRKELFAFTENKVCHVFSFSVVCQGKFAFSYRMGWLGLGKGSSPLDKSCIRLPSSSGMNGMMSRDNGGELMASRTGLLRKMDA